MKPFRKVAVALVGILALSLATSACTSDADVASTNLSKAAEQFEVYRQIVFINGITDKYLLEIDGYCSVETSESKLGGSLEVTCKLGPNEFKKHFLGLSDNVTYIVQQVDAVDVSTSNYRVIFKPELILPDIDLVTGG